MSGVGGRFFFGFAVPAAGSLHFFCFEGVGEVMVFVMKNFKH